MVNHNGDGSFGDCQLDEIRHWATRTVAPSVRLGLMSSVPDVHSAEGRDWPTLQEAFGDKPAFLVRPHIDPYTETPAIASPPTMTRHTLANLRGNIEVYPEMESSPRNGQYSKSHAFVLWECFCAAVYGSHGITINHFDMMGNGVALDPGFGPALGKAKKQLDAIAALGIDDRQADGVRVLFHPKIAASRHSTDSASMRGLCETSQIWARTLSILGIAHRFTDQVEPNEVYAVNGQTLRAFTDQEIERLLSGAVALDALSVEVLLERRFGADIGVAEVQWRSLWETAFAYEEILEANPAIYGVPNPRMTAQRCASRLLEMKPATGAETPTRIRRADHRELFPGCVFYENKYGGRIVSLAYPLDGDAQFFMGFFNAFRRIFLQRLFFSMAPEAALAAAEEHPMHVYCAPVSGGTLVAAFNVLHDTAARVTLRLPESEATRGNWKWLTPSGEWEPAKLERRDGRLIVQQPLPPLQGLFLRHTEG